MVFRVIILLTIALCTLGISDDRKLFAQDIRKYAVSQNSSTYQLLTGYSNIYGSYVNSLPIGFDYWYMGTRYTTVSVSSKGWVSLGGTLTSDIPINNLTNGGVRPVLAPLWDDIERIPGILSLLPGTISYNTTGLAWARKFTVQWNGTRWDKTAPNVIGIGGNVISFQLVLSEVNGNVEFIYRPQAADVVDGSASVGITALGAGAGNFLSVSSISSATVAATTTTETTIINEKPAAQKGILFNPDETNAPTNLTFSAVGINGMKLNWQDNSTDELGFVIYRSTSSLPTAEYTYVTKTAANVTSFNVSGLTLNTTYYYRVYALRESLSAALSGSRATLQNCSSFNMLSVASANIQSNYRMSSNANDFFGVNNGQLHGSPTSTTDRFDRSDAAYRFSGGNQFISTSTIYSNPLNFSLSIWFKTTTSTGGLLMGYSQSQTGDGAHDRILYVGTDGKIYFGVYGVSGIQTASSSTAYNDGKWHQATATQSSTNGLVLYIDGVQVAANSLGTSGEIYSPGYWRMAGLVFNVNWPSRPSSFFSGDLDDAFIFNKALATNEAQQLYSAPYGVQSNGSVCVGARLDLTGPTLADASYAWAGPNGFTSSVQNPTLTYSLAAAGTYTLTISMNGCTDLASTKVVSLNTPGVWYGGTSTAWSDASNWCDGILPTTSVDVTIPNDRPRYPLVQAAVGNARNINIESAASVIVNDNALNIAGSITKVGVFNVSNGTIAMAGTGAAQNIPANAFSDNVIKNLKITNPNGVALGGLLRLTGELGVVGTTFNANNNFLTLVASASNSANVAKLTTNSFIDGRVKVEIYVKGGTKVPYRTYRMFSSPVYDNGSTLVTSDVVGNRFATFSQLIDDMIVTGRNATGSFDITHNNENSAWVYNSGYSAIPNINTAVNAGRGMYVFYRGNRDNLQGKTTSPYVDVENNTIDFDGRLNQQRVTVPLSYTVANQFNLLGNPYAATINWDSPSWVKTNVASGISVWKPSTRSYAAYSSGVSQNGGSKYIAAGQSFFVRSTAASASITFTEDIKADTVGTFGLPLLSFVDDKRNKNPLGKISFGANANVLANRNSVIRVGVKSLTSYGEDETVLAFRDGAELSVSTNDVEHVDGEEINVSSLSIDNRKMAIKFLPKNNLQNEILLPITSSLSGWFRFKVDVSAFDGDRLIYLKDKFLEKEILVNSELVYDFEIDRNNTNTLGNDRFSLIFESPIVLSSNDLAFKASLKNGLVELAWNHKNEQGLLKYRILKAGNENEFKYFKDVDRTILSSYSTIDSNAFVGINRYKLYRIDSSGEEELAEAAVNFTLNNTSELQISPNPVKNFVSVKCSTLADSDQFTLTIIDLLGSKKYEKKLRGRQLNLGYSVDASFLESGMYFVKVQGTHTKFTEKILVEK